MILLTAMGQAVASSMLFCQMDMPMSGDQMPGDQVSATHMHGDMDMMNMPDQLSQMPDQLPHLHDQQAQMADMSMSADMPMSAGMPMSADVMVGDCCDSDCSCTVGCSSAPIPYLTGNQNIPLANSQSISLYLAQAICQMPTSLYRPPIFS